MTKSKKIINALSEYIEISKLFVFQLFQLFIQQRTTFVVKKKFAPFDHLVVCCCIMLYVVVSCLHEVCSQSKMFVEQMLCNRTFLLFSVMLHVVAFV